jgi:hypothetical protein
MRTLLAISALIALTIMATPGAAQSTAPEEQPSQAQSSGCSCCQKMAMMQAPKEDGQETPGMQMPAPEAPKANP